MSSNLGVKTASIVRKKTVSPSTSTASIRIDQGQDLCRSAEVSQDNQDESVIISIFGAMTTAPIVHSSSHQRFDRTLKSFNVTSEKAEVRFLVDDSLAAGNYQGLRLKMDFPNGKTCLLELSLTIIDEEIIPDPPINNQQQQQQQQTSSNQTTNTNTQVADQCLGCSGNNDIYINPIIDPPYNGGGNSNGGGQCPPSSPPQVILAESGALYPPYNPSSCGNTGLPPLDPCDCLEIINIGTGASRCCSQNTSSNTDDARRAMEEAEKRARELEEANNNNSNTSTQTTTDTSNDYNRFAISSPSPLPTVGPTSCSSCSYLAVSCTPTSCSSHCVDYPNLSTEQMMQCVS